MLCIKPLTARPCPLSYAAPLHVARHLTTSGTLDKSERTFQEPELSDTPMNRKVPFGRDLLDYMWRMAERNPEGIVEDVLRRMETVRNCAPFDIEIYTELSEIGFSILKNVPVELQDHFLRAVSHDKKRRIDAMRVCEARMTIFRTLAPQEPEYVLKRVNYELGTLPFTDTYVHSPHARRETLTFSDDERKLYEIYRLNLEALHLELIVNLGQPGDREILLWGIGDTAMRMQKTCNGHVNGSRNHPDLPEQAIQ